MKNTEKKTVKTSTKKTSKKKVEFKPKYVYDITMCVTETDVLYIFGASNLIYGLPVSADMQEAILATCKEDILYLAATLFDGDILMRCGNSFTEPANASVFTVNADEKAVVSNGKVEVKKKNVFKRLWNKITRKK